MKVVIFFGTILIVIGFIYRLLTKNKNWDKEDEKKQSDVAKFVAKLKKTDLIICVFDDAGHRAAVEVLLGQAAFQMGCRHVINLPTIHANNLFKLKKLPKCGPELSEALIVKGLVKRTTNSYEMGVQLIRINDGSTVASKSFKTNRSSNGTSPLNGMVEETLAFIVENL